jgi:hypothetical protein
MCGAGACVEWWTPSLVSYKVVKISKGRSDARDLRKTTVFLLSPYRIASIILNDIAWRTTGHPFSNAQRLNRA